MQGRSAELPADLPCLYEHIKQQTSCT